MIAIISLYNNHVKMLSDMISEGAILKIFLGSMP